MKLLLTSDLHFRADWFAWLLKEAPKYDAIAVAGDLGDLFHAMPPQAEDVRAWVAKMKLTGTPLLLCDGNHDLNGTVLPWTKAPESSLSPEQEAFIERASLAEHWMDALIEEGASVVGGMVKTFSDLDGLIVTSLRYGSDHDDENISLMKEGARLRRTSDGASWVVLHHQPPIGVLGREGMGNSLFGDWIEEFQPRIVVCGHDHKSPFANGTCCKRIGQTYVFNCGHNPKKRYPCHISLDTKLMKYCWVH